jgi:hypothetical protein
MTQRRLMVPARAVMRHGGGVAAYLKQYYAVVAAPGPAVAAGYEGMGHSGPTTFAFGPTWGEIHQGVPKRRLAPEMLPLAPLTAFSFWAVVNSGFMP